jgi:hypothetical protein
MTNSRHVLAFIYKHVYVSMLYFYWNKKLRIMVLEDSVSKTVVKKDRG